MSASVLKTHQWNFTKTWFSTVPSISFGSKPRNEARWTAGVQQPFKLHRSPERQHFNNSEIRSQRNVALEFLVSPGCKSSENFKTDISKSQLSFQVKNVLQSLPWFEIHFPLFIFLSQSCLFGAAQSSLLLHKPVTELQVKFLCFDFGGSHWRASDSLESRGGME